MAMYKGFSTVDRNKKFRVTDFELCKQDLLNHFNIRKGTKLMNPDFGTVIWDTLFDPLTDAVKTTIINDIKKIVGYDPRITVSNVTITEYEHGIQIILDLIYVQRNTKEQMFLQFARDARKVNLI